MNIDERRERSKMRRLLIFICLIIFSVPAICENIIINPGFDEEPWDTGWTWGGGSVEGITFAAPDSEKYRSYPQSCLLHAQVRWYYGGVDLYQEILPVTSCTCMAYFQTMDCSDTYAWTEYAICVKVNGRFIGEWYCESGSNPVWTKWEKTYGESDTVSGIYFAARGFSQLHGCNGEANFWIEDVYISGTVVGIEEYRHGVTLEIYPNPFTERVYIYYSLEGSQYTNGCGNLRLRIYNIAGSCIRELDNILDYALNHYIWDGRDSNGNKVLPGVYFITIEPYKGTRICLSKRIVKF